jgi:sugar lactone lactonase YvrE
MDDCCDKGKLTQYRYPPSTAVAARKKPSMTSYSQPSKPAFRRIAGWMLAAPLALAAQLCLASGDISFNADTVYPEGVAWVAPQKSFLVSSIHHGTIGKVGLDGAYTPFITDDKLVASVGLTLDPKSNTLWVAVGDLGASDRSGPATQGKLAGVAAYDATTGARRAYHDLGGLHAGGHFANDLTLDAQGNVYITDSFSPVIYKVDTAGKATVFVNDARFTGEGFNLNGIVYHPDGYLLVNKYNSGELFRISLKDPRQITSVKLPEALIGADGMVLREPGRLTVVQNSGVDRIVDLVSTDGWATATVQRVQKSVLSFPTTAATVGPHLYVVNARLDSLLTPDAPKVNSFVLQKY